MKTPDKTLKHDIWCLDNDKDTNEGLICSDSNFQMLLIIILKATNETAIRSFLQNTECQKGAGIMLSCWISEC